MIGIFVYQWQQDSHQEQEFRQEDACSNSLVQWFGTENNTNQITTD